MTINLVVIIALLMGLSISSTPICAEKIKQVEVINDESNPIPIGQPVDVNVMNGGSAFQREPFQRSAIIYLSEGECEDLDVFQVPEGKRLVIETVSTQAFLRAEQIFYFFIATYVGDNRASHYFPMPQPIPEDLDFFQGIHQVLIYADPKTDVTSWLWRDYEAGTAGLTVTISGYFLPADSPILSP